MTQAPLASPAPRSRPLARLGACALLTLAGCGDAPAPPAPPSAPTLSQRPGSAFRFVVDPEGVRHDIPSEQVKQGIPLPNPRDRIPAILAPRFQDAADATHVAAHERVLVLVVGDDARAYPLRMLDAHELVNDVVGGVPVLVTWCPLCRSAMAFERTVAGEVRTFGVSGFLYRSAVLMYDHASETFWSQIAARAVVGPLTGTTLVQRPVGVTTFGAFRAAHAEGRVLGPEQAGRVPSDYLRDHYADYHARAGLMFQVDAFDGRLRLKEEVLGVVRPGGTQAWSMAYVRALPRGPQAVEVGGERLVLDYDAAADAVRIVTPDGLAVPSLRCYWFAWYAFHPETGLEGGAAVATPRGRDEPR